MTNSQLAPDDLLTAANVCQESLLPGVDQDWSVKAGDLEWDCRRTLDHIVDTLFLYAAYLASRGNERLSPPRNGDPSASPAQLLATVGTSAAVLAEVARAAPPGTRAFHPAGMADVSGWIGMACVEILLHTGDIARGLDLPYRPPDDLCSRVLTRLFPWAPLDMDPWDSLCWAAGRTALADRERLGPDWYWHCTPLAEWDGTIKKRTAPPAWK
jgi:uncharacterized protein (TIGR03083 family)